MYYTFNTGENFRLRRTYNTFNTYNTYDTRAPLRGFVLYHPTSVQYPALARACEYEGHGFTV
jgi:hypothetical protein